MSKEIFKCLKCKYFPASIEIQNSFLNSDTFKCPSCLQLSSFNQNSFFLLHSQFHSQQNSTQSYHSDSINQSYEASSKQQIQQCQSNRNTFFICIEKGQWVLQPLYLNPINPQLKNSFNLSKQQILQENKMVLFCINDQILRKFTQSHKKPSTLKSLKYQSRKILKIQHLLYCIDLYIQGIYQGLYQSENDQSFDVVLQMIHEKTKNSESNGTTEIQILKDTTQRLLKFNIKTYFEFQSFSQQQSEGSERQKLESPQNKALEEFNKKVRTFLKIFYFDNQLEDEQKNICPKESEIYQNRSIGAFALFSNKFQVSRVHDLMSSKIEKIHSVQGNRMNQFLTHSFYFENSQVKNFKQASNCNDLVQQYQLNNISLFHSSLYIPHCKSSANSYSIIRQAIDKSIQNFEKLQNVTDRQSVLKDNRPIQLVEKNNSHVHDQRMTIRNKSSRKNSVDQNSSQTQIDIYWKLMEHSQNLYQIKLNTYKVKSLQNAGLKSLAAIFKDSKTQLDQSMSEQLEKQITSFLVSDPARKHSVKNMRLDRVYAKTQNSSVFYIFNYDQIARQNYEELDFLDEHYLPNQLKGYSATYQSPAIKVTNPFKKASHRVCMAIQNQTPESKSIDHQSSDDDMQKL